MNAELTRIAARPTNAEIVARLKVRDRAKGPTTDEIVVLSALRGLHLGRRLDARSADDAGRDHFAFTISRHELSPLADRVWDLRHRFTTCDASYLALAEALGAPLYT